MKKLYNPLPTGGAPVFTETLNDLESELWTGVQAIFNTLDPTDMYPDAWRLAPSTYYVSTGIVVSGGEVTDNTTDWDMAAGIAYFPVTGKFARFAAEATIDNADHAMITLDSPAVTQKTFFDASNKNYYEEYTASVATLTPPAAEPVVEYVCMRKSREAASLCRMGHPTFGNIIFQLANFVGPGVFTVLTPTNGWTGTSSYANNYGQFTKITLSAETAISAGTDVFCSTLPSKYQPALTPVIGHVIGSTSGTIYPVHIDTGGNITIIGGSGQTETYIQGNILFLNVLI